MGAPQALLVDESNDLVGGDAQRVRRVPDLVRSLPVRHRPLVEAEAAQLRRPLRRGGQQSLHEPQPRCQTRESARIEADAVGGAPVGLLGEELPCVAAQHDAVPGDRYARSLATE